MSHFRFLVCSRFNYRQFVIPLIFGKKGGLNYLNFEIAGFDLRNVTVSSIFFCNIHMWQTFLCSLFQIKTTACLKVFLRQIRYSKKI